MVENGADRGTPSDDGMVRQHHDRAKPVSVTVVECLAAASGRSAESVEPLYEHIDTEALDALFAPTPAGNPRGPGQLSFVLDDYLVTVDSDGWVTVRPREESVRR